MDEISKMASLPLFAQRRVGTRRVWCEGDRGKDARH